MAYTEGDEGGYELIMPFIVSQSRGGPIDDDAFAAGFHAGRIDLLLEFTRLPLLQETVRSDLVPQLDLIAMRHGFTLHAEPTNVEGWTYATFARSQGRPALNWVEIANHLIDEHGMAPETVDGEDADTCRAIHAGLHAATDCGHPTWEVER